MRYTPLQMAVIMCSKKSAIVSGFEPYSLRMVKVRAYKTVNGKTSYGAFSQAVMVIVK